MRKTSKEVFLAFLAGKPNRKQESIWTDGRAIYSYELKIAWQEGGDWYVHTRNSTKTTNSKISEFMVWLSSQHIQSQED